MADSRYTLYDYAKSENPDGKQAQVYEVQNQINSIYEDAWAFPSNAMVGNRVTLRAGMPVVQGGKVNKGAPRSKATTEQRTDSIAMVHGRSEIDIKAKKILGEAAFQEKRVNDDKAWMEAIAQYMAQLMVYGNVQNDETAMDGLQPRMASLQTSSYAKSWVQSAGGAGNRTSIYVVDWGEGGAGIAFPQESIAGIDVMDLGMQAVNDNDGNTLTVLATEFIQTVGLSVKDPRHIGRLANIDYTDAYADAPTKNLINLLIRFMANMINPGGRQRVLYMHRQLLAGFYQQAVNKSNAALSIRDYLTQPTPHFWNYPMRAVDQISLAESAVT